MKTDIGEETIISST